MRDDALIALLHKLKSRRYEFVTVTPATHARVLARPQPGPLTLRDVFGWNRPFAADAIDPAILELMQATGIVDTFAGQLRSGLRVASLAGELFFHSAFPTDGKDSVFFGPDTYRFVRFVAAQSSGLSPRRMVDLGTGGGAAGIALARSCPDAEVSLVDTNQTALDLARVNARAAGVSVKLVAGAEVPDGADLVIANPPYMMDQAGRSYRDGGSLYGGQAALDWTREALVRLRPGGTLLLYTGGAVVAGRSPLIEAIDAACDEAHARVQVDEIDPDVFGEELEQPNYREVERIAALGFTIRKAD